MNGASVLIAFETSGPVGSVALAVDGELAGRVFLGERGGHAAALIPAVEDALAQAGLPRDAITGVVVGSGPGSFTGVRVGAAAGKGLAHGLGVPLYGVSSLMAAALTEEAIPGDVGPWASPGPRAELHLHVRYVLFDARGDRVFTAAYRLTGGIPETLREPTFAHLPEILEDTELAGAGFCGDGAQRHAGLLQEEGRLVLPPPVGFPSADGLLRYASLSPDFQPLADPFAWEPEYLRASNAERGKRG